MCVSRHSMCLSTQPPSPFHPKTPPGTTFAICNPATLESANQIRAPKFVQGIVSVPDNLDAPTSANKKRAGHRNERERKPLDSVSRAQETYINIFGYVSPVREQTSDLKRCFGRKANITRRLGTSFPHQLPQRARLRVTEWTAHSCSLVG